MSWKILFLRYLSKYCYFNKLFQQAWVRWPGAGRPRLKFKLETALESHLKPSSVVITATHLFCNLTWFFCRVGSCSFFSGCCQLTAANIRTISLHQAWVPHPITSQCLHLRITSSNSAIVIHSEKLGVHYGSYHRLPTSQTSSDCGPIRYKNWTVI